MLKKIYFALISLVLPVVSFAQLTQTETLLTEAEKIVRTILIPLVFTLALLFFFYGIAKYIWGEGQGKDDGKKIMIWGVVALFVMSSIWGLVAFMRGELLIDQNNSTMPIPTITK